ncbi:GntR family transcriptional regulator [Streptomyces sp. NPDC006365]|uniref:GntR family transcriptional regulator n=1 Tax=Streptomyces sp. NPDC006365 TaxID=3364744 RepID=UPI00367AA440
MARRPMPRHEAVERHIRGRIAGLKPGDQIESDAELCDLFQVSRMTVRQATQRLVAEGAIYRISGVGTFVGEPQVHRQMGKLRSFTEEMALRGMTVSSTVLASELRVGSQEETTALRLAPQSNIVHVRRLRLADEQPMAIENVVLPPSCAWLLREDLAHGSLHQALTEQGFAPSRATGTQIAAIATEDDAALLELPVGAAIFVERRLITTGDGTPVELTESRYAGSRFVFHIELA